MKMKIKIKMKILFFKDFPDFLVRRVFVVRTVFPDPTVIQDPKESRGWWESTEREEETEM